MIDSDFKPGLYRHYKGRLYSALALVRHHETGEPMVLYASLDRGTFNVRPLRGWKGDEDGFIEMVELEDGERMRRFRYLGQPESGEIR